jgi:hypothetical protein
MQSHFDLTLIPSFFKERSESEIDAFSCLSGKPFKRPASSSNMPRVINGDISSQMYFQGFGFITDTFNLNT